jgi:hypothetical protein
MNPSEARRRLRIRARQVVDTVTWRNGPGHHERRASAFCPHVELGRRHEVAGERHGGQEGPAGGSARRAAPPSPDCRDDPPRGVATATGTARVEDRLGGRRPAGRGAVRRRSRRGGRRAALVDLAGHIAAADARRDRDHPDWK